MAGLAALRRVLLHPEARVPHIKPDGTPVTAGDLAVQMAVCSVLERRSPGIGVIGEESESSALGSAGEQLMSRAVRAVREAMGSDAPADPTVHITRKDPSAGSTWWTVDPIDGTKGFRSGRHYALCLALVEQGRASIGVLSCPTIEFGKDPLAIGHDAQCGTIYAALAGSGAWKYAPEEGQTKPPHSGSKLARSQERKSQWLVCDSVEGSERAVRMRGVMDATGLNWTSVSLDSQCKYALVAEGTADCFMRVPGSRGAEKVWDHAPGAVVAAEAGAIVSDLEGNPLEFVGESLGRNTGTLACDTHISGQVVAASCGQRSRR